MLTTCDKKECIFNSNGYCNTNGLAIKNLKCTFFLSRKKHEEARQKAFDGEKE